MKTDFLAWSLVHLVQAKAKNSYSPNLVEICGIEPQTPCLQSRCSPSWAIPPYLWVWRPSGPSKLNNDYLQWFLPIWPWMLNRSLSNDLVSIERRWSSRRFSYGYLVTTSPQSPILPSAASSTRVRLLTSGITGSHGVTGGVYKTRERIHRGMLIRDY